ncbi:unnamed protein product [Meloidogyne enterolobii]|uniref:Uncharacterized protein n=2 Tax=Meloidogyne enterolobii TaxID=390850 RepID=A0A6V7X8X0_MELEN|nr:unnamed protein product [Meloidogyne enterolobii]
MVLYFFLFHNNGIGSNILVNARLELGFRLGNKIILGPKLVWTYRDGQIWIGMTKITSCVFRWF